MKKNKEKQPLEEEAVNPDQSIEEATRNILPQEQQLVKQDADIDGFLAKRAEFITKVNAIMVEGKDYHVIQGKKSLAKGGAEKIASIFHWTAKFEKDTQALEMIGEIKGWIAFKCTLMNGQFVGEGRGAALLTKNSGDLNKTLKMAEKSAFIDAVLRASGLSDFFTQDLENMPQEQISRSYVSNNAFKHAPRTYPNDIYLGFKARIGDSDTSASLDLIESEAKIAYKNAKLTYQDVQDLASISRNKRALLVDNNLGNTLKEKSYKLAQGIREKRDNTPAAIVEKYNQSK